MYLKLILFSNTSCNVNIGVECASMDTFTDGTVNYSLMSMFVPKVIEVIYFD